MTGSFPESPYIFGIYEPGGEQHMLDIDRPGWIVFSESVGHDPADRSGVDFSSYSDLGLGVICRISNGYEPDGTIPHSGQYEDFARRVANFVSTSRGCKIWVIGNEMNYAAERPGVVIDWSRHHTQRSGPPEEADPYRRGVPVRFNALPDLSTEIRTTRGAIVSAGEVITPERYARCYRLSREAIRRLPGHSDDQVIVGAVAPWNSQTIYDANPNGDWVQYFQDILTLLGPDGCDGFALHAFTRGAEPTLVASEARLDAPFRGHYREFRVYRDFLAAVPKSMRDLPAYITETDQNQPWTDANTGWIQAAYAEIDEWNRQAESQPIRCLALYRWPKTDRWFIEGKLGVLDDFLGALAREYRWRASELDGKPVIVRPAAEPTAPFRVEWVDDQLPERFVAGETVTIHFELRNIGRETWTWGGGNPFRLGYHYYRNRRRLEMAAEQDVRTDVPHDVAPGERIGIDCRVALPGEPGNYTVEFDLVQEGKNWFKETGSAVLTRWFVVEAPTRLTEEGSNGGGPSLPVPLFQDVGPQLPRSGTAYARRSLDQIQSLVISHSGGHPKFGLDRIAQTHIRSGYPGIVYDFVVDDSGQVYKVTDLEDVAQPRDDWSLHGVNICLTGDFSKQAPPLPQLEATGRLCAWLARNLSLAPEDIIGLGELTQTDSPGRTFYRNPNWQQLLQRQVQLHLAVLASGAEQSLAAEQDTRLIEADREVERLNAALEQTQIEQRDLRLLNERLQQDVADLRAQTAERSGIDQRRPPIQDISQRLPRDPSRYVLRSGDEIEQIVINHTGASVDVPLERIAESHMPDWPGLLFDFCVGEDGAIYQTQPLDQVVDTGLAYLAKAINIAFIGDFASGAPTHAQLYAGAQLIAWLMDRMPQLTTGQIKGLSEMTDEVSPGGGWLSGRAWKQDLVGAVNRARGLVETSVVEQELREQLSDTTEQIATLKRNVSVLQEQRQHLQDDYQAMQQAATSQENRAAFHVPSPPIRNVIDQLPRHPSLRYERRTANRITHVAVHHTATLPIIGPVRIAELHVNAEPARGKEAWPGIGYHYFIHADGAIDQTNTLETVSYHVFQHNTYTLGIAFAGSFMNGQLPTSAQLTAGAHLIAWLMQEYDIPLARVWGHREFSDNVTVCPGSEWLGGQRWRDQLYEQIDDVQKGIGIKSIRHYLLFWQRSYPGPLARQDFINAIGYVDRFRPSLGFSVEDARNAEYVTIVGNEAGIGSDIEEVLRAGGAKVERIAGRNEDETGRMLAELARLGRRFRSFEVDF